MIKLHGMSEEFHSVDDLRRCVCEVCKEKVVMDTFGFIEPGHGAKGKQRWLTSHEDLKEMYVIHQGKKEILLWCYAADQGQKRSQSSDEPEAKRTRYDKQTDKMSEVQEIEEKLRQKYPNGPYSEEQLRSWAHLIQMCKHSSYDVPPNKPFWKTRSKQISSGTEIAISPGKRVNLRGQCVQQLLQLHELLEKGGISKEQYEDMKGTIMNEVKHY